MGLTPVLAVEEYIEQAYFFRALRERLGENRPAQEILKLLDDIALSLEKVSSIDGFEKKQASAQPWL